MLRRLVRIGARRDIIIDEIIIRVFRFTIYNRDYYANEEPAITIPITVAAFVSSVHEPPLYSSCRRRRRRETSCVCTLTFVRQKIGIRPVFRRFFS